MANETSRNSWNDTTKLSDTTGAPINPATEDKQDAAIDAINTDYFVESALGNISDTASVVITGNNPNMTANTEELIWDQGGLYTYLTSETTLYASSTNAADTAITVACPGLDGNYDQVTRTVTLNGQTQVALSGDLLRVFDSAVFGSAEPLGDIYIAESDTLTDGVPDTASKIKGKIIQGNNVSKNAFYTVPAGFSAVVLDILLNAPKNDDILFEAYSRSEGGVWRLNFPADIYQNTIQPQIIFKYGEKTDFETRGTASNTGTTGTFLARILLIEN